MLRYILILLISGTFLAVSFAQEQSDAPNAAEEESSLESAPKASSNIDTLDIKDMDINDVLRLLASKTGLNIIAGKTITGRVTIFLQNVDVRDALTIILKANDLAYIESRGVIQIVTSAEYEQLYGFKFGVIMDHAVVPLKTLKASEVLGLLSQVKSMGGKIVADDQSNSLIIEETPERLKMLRNYITQMDVPLQRSSKVFRISYAKVEDLAKTIAPLLTKDTGTLQYDTRSATIVVSDIDAVINKISTVIKALDRNDNEVLIEAKIVQIQLSDAYQMGINWEVLIPDAQRRKVDLKNNFSLPSNVTPVSVTTIGTLDRDDYNVVLQMIASLGKSRLLSNPRIAVVNNQEAKILVGSTTPYVTNTTTTPATGPTTTAENVNFIDTGVKLHVTPTIHEDGYITMKIKPEVSNIPRSITTSVNNQIPVVDTAEVETVVRVKDGVTIIIGGLIKDELRNTKNKIPILGDIPFVGKVFRNEVRSTDKTEIVIFLTPKIISGDVAISPDEYDYPTIKSNKNYYNPLPKDESTIPVP